LCGWLLAGGCGCGWVHVSGFGCGGYVRVSTRMDSPFTPLPLLVPLSPRKHTHTHTHAPPPPQNTHTHTHTHAQTRKNSLASYVDRLLPSERGKDPTDCLSPLLPLVRALRVCVGVVCLFLGVGGVCGWLRG
jgi:hypothetical protein